MKDYIVFDAETKLYSDQVTGGWDNVYGMGLASAVTYDSKTDNYMFWNSDNQNDLLDYLNNKIVVTYNGISFDSRLLLGNDRTIELNGYTRNLSHGWYNVDIYVEMWRHIMGMDKSNYPKIIEEQKKRKPPKNVMNLHSVSLATLNHTKSGSGKDAPKLFQEGKIIELFQYNLQDVRVTRELFQFILKNRYVLTGNYEAIVFKEVIK